MNVLLVDDNYNALHTMRRGLEHSGFVVRAVLNVSDACDAMDASAPDVILTDLLMPNGGGVAVLEYARAVFPHRVPVVCITGMGEADPEFDAVLQKPCSLREIERTIRALLT